MTTIPLQQCGWSAYPNPTYGNGRPADLPYD
jgi:hypothetical protein